MHRKQCWAQRTTPAPAEGSMYKNMNPAFAAQITCAQKEPIPIAVKTPPNYCSSVLGPLGK